MRSLCGLLITAVLVLGVASTVLAENGGIDPLKVTGGKSTYRPEGNNGTITPLEGGIINPLEHGPIKPW